MQYGVRSFDSEPIGNFQGIKGTSSTDTASGTDAGNGVNSREAEVHQAYYKVMRAESVASRKEAEGELAAILARRQEADAQFSRIASIIMSADAANVEKMLEG